ncbi:S4 domain-containing protein [Orrella sp. JC864]|uniref:S4 domain-containing protein n=1 Tax=Orrella sp. JC864 TaxID=3120298 RepID=UPI0012BCC6BA
MEQEGSVRLDKWLWAARFFKTRSLASAAVEAGRVQANGARAKPSRAVRPGDRLAIVGVQEQWEVTVTGLADKRGSATVARGLYEETASSVAARQQRAEQRRLWSEPAQGRAGRPTKRERRDLDRYRQG